MRVKKDLYILRMEKYGINIKVTIIIYNIMGNMTFYDSIAPGYKELYEGEQAQKLKKITTLVPTSGGKMLDIGAGTCLASKFFDHEYFAIEPSKKLIEYSKHVANIPKDNIVIGDDWLLQKLKGKYDLIIAVTSAHHFIDINNAVKHIKRILSLNGYVVISVLTSSQKNIDIKNALSTQFQVDITVTPKETYYVCQR